jgi:hypothetical protein
MAESIGLLLSGASGPGTLDVCKKPRIWSPTPAGSGQVKEFGKLKEASRSFVFFDPCRLVRQVKEFGKLRAPT